MIQKLLPLALLLVPTLSPAADLSARRCEISLKNVRATYSSHSSASMQVTVKVGWIGNGETVRRVGAYQIERAHDLGNQPGCHFSPPERKWHLVDAAPGERVGESFLSFRISTGAVTSACPGYDFSNEVAFFVQTDRNTYWLNPGFDPSKGFVFDRYAFKLNLERGGSYTYVPTWRDDMKYYNPGNCR